MNIGSIFIVNILKEQLRYNKRSTYLNHTSSKFQSSALQLRSITIHSPNIASYLDNVPHGTSSVELYTSLQVKRHNVSVANPC